jgi:hypothetical protein
VDIATLTECEMVETANNFAVAGYMTFLPLVPKGKSKTRVIILVKNDLVTRANAHVCHNFMDNKTQSVWLRFGPVPPMGGFTLCGLYRTWLDHDRQVFNVPEATERLEAFNSQITRAAERYARVVVHGDLNLDLDWSGDLLYARRNLLATLLESPEAAGLETHYRPPSGTPKASTGFDSLAREVAGPRTEVTNLATDVADSVKEVASLATEVTDEAKEVTDSATVPTSLTHAVHTQHAWTKSIRVASPMRPQECWRTAPQITARSLPLSRLEEV